jgi:hypothetical protein
MERLEADDLAQSFAWMGSMQVAAMIAASVVAWSLVRDRVPHRAPRA